jgi:hypothetical protein
MKNCENVERGIILAFSPIQFAALAGVLATRDLHVSETNRTNFRNGIERDSYTKVFISGPAAEI